MALLKKENICISKIYGDEGKKMWKTIGEIVTFSDEQGSVYQKINLWGPGGFIDASVFEPTDAKQATPRAPLAQPQPQYPQSQQAPQQSALQQPQGSRDDIHKNHGF